MRALGRLRREAPWPSSLDSLRTGAGPDFGSSWWSEEEKRSRSSRLQVRSNVIRVDAGTWFRTTYRVLGTGSEASCGSTTRSIRRRYISVLLWYSENMPVALDGAKSTEYDHAPPPNSGSQAYTFSPSSCKSLRAFPSLAGMRGSPPRILGATKLTDYKQGRGP